MMTIKLENLVIWLGILIFFSWYIPTSYMNVFACDDYWFGSYIHDLGFWETQAHFYNNWEGSYTHTFLASLPHVIPGNKVPFLCNTLSLSILIYAIYVFVTTFLKITKKQGITTSLYITSLLFVATSGDSEIRFWVCANFTYLPELALVLIFVSRYHMLSIGKSKLHDWALIVLLLIGIAGSKLTFIAVAFLCILSHDIITKRKIDKSSLIIYGLLLSFTMVNVLAPGNLIRLGDEHLQNEDAIKNFSLFGNIIERLKIQTSVFLYSFLLIPISAKYAETLQISRRFIFCSVIVIAVGFITESIIMHVCFGDPGPKRIYFTYDLAILLFMFLIFGVTIKSIKINLKSYISIVAAILFIFINIPFLYKIKPSIEYSKNAQERDEIVMSANDGEVIYLPTLPDSYLMLSYFSNEIGWIENVYLPYFDKHNSVILLNDFDKTE